jgi:hypothetical protein
MQKQIEFKGANDWGNFPVWATNNQPSAEQHEILKGRAIKQTHS